MIGKTIGNYSITGEIAAGGMGAVYRGRHLSLPREVVVKSILLSSFPPQHREPLKARFRREAFVQSQLDHPNIVKVYEFFTPAENYYLVMEFVDGMSLQDLIRRQGALDPGHAAGLLKQALSALDYAHNFSYVDESGNRFKGIVHRDIKPANLLLDGQARLKITDFGIVKIQGESGMTRAGFNPGTMEYMSPEQIRGYEVDPRSDLYSLGVTFYEALTGRLPFPPSGTGSDYEVARGHIEMAPPPISTVRPDIPPRLAAIIMRSLEKKTEDRYQSAAEFLQAVEGYESTAGPVTHSMTERIPETQPVESAKSTNPPTPSIETNVIPKSEPAPAGDGKGSAVRMAIPAVLAVAILVIAVSAGYFLLSRPGAGQSSPGPQPTVAPAGTPQPEAVPQGEEDELLAEARRLEDRELYAEAVRKYDQYLNSNPASPDSSAIKDRISTLKQLQGLLTIAEIELSQGDFAAARRDFSEALKIRPDSVKARQGLDTLGKRTQKD